LAPEVQYLKSSDKTSTAKNKFQTELFLFYTD